MQSTKHLFLTLVAGLLLTLLPNQAHAQAEVMDVQALDATADAWVYYSLRENREVDLEEDGEDAWDLAFMSVQIRVNGTAQVVEQAFDEVAEAPEEGYRKDTPDGTAIPGGSGQGWYVYDMDTHVIAPVPNRTIVVKTAAGTYAKVEIKDFYLPGFNEPRFYTFRFAHQADGTRAFQ